MIKLKLFISFILGLTILSCSSTDDSNSPQQPQQLKLTKIEQKTYNNGVLEEKNIFVFQNQKPYSAHFYNAVNELTFKSFWYFTNGLLTTIKGYMPDETLYQQSNIIYDNSNRIIQISSSEDNNTYQRTTNYIYNNNNTITSNTNNNGNITSKTFEINSNGLIDKEIANGNIILSVQYENSTPISKTAYSTTSNYTYHPTGLFPILEQDFYGNNLKNVVLSRNSLNDSFESLTNKLVTSVTSTSQDHQCVYTFNQSNFPVTKKEYHNGTLTDEFIYYYQ